MRTDKEIALRFLISIYDLYELSIGVLKGKFCIFDQQNNGSLLVWFYDNWKFSNLQDVLDRTNGAFINDYIWCEDEQYEDLTQWEQRVVDFYGSNACREILHDITVKEFNSITYWNSNYRRDWWAMDYTTEVEKLLAYDKK